MSGGTLDLILENAQVLDGTGRAPFPADVGIRGERIEVVGNLAGASAARRIDAAGRTVCPGFIDAHSHADLTFFKEDTAAALAPLVKQGITTFVGGNCGMALAPIAEENRAGQQTYLEIFTQMDFDTDIRWSSMGSFLEHMDRKGVPLNSALLAPHGLMRIAASGLQARLAHPDELATMERLLEESLEAGAFGLSAGLQYFPGNQSDAAELELLGHTLARHGGILASHLRSYTNHTLKLAIDELAEVSSRTGIRTQVSHIFCLPWFGRFHNTAMRVVKWLAAHGELALRLLPTVVTGDMARIVEQLDRLRGQGAEIAMDIMPTTAGFAHLMAFFPSWTLVGTREEFLARIAAPATRREMLHDIEHGTPSWPHRGKSDGSLNLVRQMGWDALTVMAVHSEKNRPMEGRRFTEIAEEQGRHPFDVMCELLIEENGRVIAFESLGEPDDLFTERSTFPALQDPWTMVGTDSVLLGIGKPSHLFYGCYPKFLQRYVYELKLLDLPGAVARCTSLVADWFGIADRGRVAEGCYADLLLLEPERFRTAAVFRDPEIHPEGLDLVIINGKVVVEDGELRRRAPAGKMLRRA